MMCAGPASTLYQNGVVEPADLNGVGYRWLRRHTQRIRARVEVRITVRVRKTIEVCVCTGFMVGLG